MQKTMTKRIGGGTIGGGISFSYMWTEEDGGYFYITGIPELEGVRWPRTDISSYAYNKAYDDMRLAKSHWDENQGQEGSVTLYYMQQAESQALDLELRRKQEAEHIERLDEIQKTIYKVDLTGLEQAHEELEYLTTDVQKMKLVLGEADIALDQRREELGKVTDDITSTTQTLYEIQAQAEAAGTTLEETLMLIEQTEEISKETTKSIEQIKFGGGGNWMRNIALGVGAFILILVFGAVAIKSVLD